MYIMTLWDLTMRVMMVCIVGCSCGVVATLLVETILRCLYRRRTPRYKRATVVPVQDVANVTTQPITGYAVDVRVAPVTVV